MSVLNLSEITFQIRQLCEIGFDVDDDTWNYMQTTLFDPTPSSVAAIVNDADDSESDSLIDLLFYPDEAMQVFLEPIIESTVITYEDQDNLIELLLSQSFFAKLTFTAFNETIDIRMPELAVRQFVSRLNLTYKQSGSLIDIIKRQLPADLGNIIRVRLRNLKMDLADYQIELLSMVLMKLNHAHPDYLFWFDFVLSILPETTPSTHFYDFFMDKKKFYLRSIEKAKLFLERLQRNNMETLMLQGERAAFLSPEEGRKIVACIDQICWAIFGRSDNFQPLKKDEINVGDLQSPRNLEKIIDYLS